MKRSTIVVVMIAMLVATPGSASAQSVAEGSLVRVETAKSKYVGTLQKRTQERLTLQTESGGLFQVSRADIERVEVSLGRKRNAGKGALIGALAFGGLSAALGASTDECNPLDFRPTTATGCRTENVATFFLAGAVGGALWGAIIGHFVKSERWKEVEGSPRITLILPERGIGAQVSLGW